MTMQPQHNHYNGQEVDAEVFKRCPRCSRRSPTTCPHVWAKQDNYSDPGHLHRFLCSVCGVWGYTQMDQGFKHLKVRAYFSRGQHTYEPKLEWKRDWEREVINENPMNVVSGRNPDRNTPDDDAADYRPPRRV